MTAAIRQLRQTDALIAGLIVNEVAGSEDYDHYYGDAVPGDGSALDPLTTAPPPS